MRGDGFDGDFVRERAFFDLLQANFDAVQTCLVFEDFLFDLGTGEGEHPPEPVGVEIFAVFEQVADLFEGEAHLFEGDDAMELGELVNRVIAVARPLVYLPGFEQAELIVVAQHPGRNLAEFGEFTDLEHESILHFNPVSRSSDLHHNDAQNIGGLVDLIGHVRDVAINFSPAEDFHHLIHVFRLFE